MATPIKLAMDETVRTHAAIIRRFDHSKEMSALLDDDAVSRSGEVGGAAARARVRILRNKWKRLRHNSIILYRPHPLCTA